MAKRSSRQLVVTFDERKDQGSSSLRGRKGANLAEMRAMGMPVPPGFTIFTKVARAQMQNGVLPKRLDWHMLRCMGLIERASGRKFGDPNNPLIVSVRSGAEYSMPGMMDTVLNLGITGWDLSGLVERGGEGFARDCEGTFISMFSEIVLGKKNLGRIRRMLQIPSDPWQQLSMAVIAILSSWGSERAVAYRKRYGIPNTLGTAVNVQEMVFGNLPNSCTGVAFSRNPNTGENVLYGEFLEGEQGERIVSGDTTPPPICEMRKWNEEAYLELASHVASLENHRGTIVEVEFTVQKGKLWLLQSRDAKLKSEAKATLAVHRVWAKQASKHEACTSLSPEDVEKLKTPSTLSSPKKKLAKGIPASSGAAVGYVAKTNEEAVELAKKGLPVVLVRRTTSPDDLPGMLVSRAIVTLTGGATCHAAVVARQLEIPAVVGVGNQYLMDIPSGIWLSVCGNTGTVYEGRYGIVESSHKKEVNLFLKWEREHAYPPARIDFAMISERARVDTILADMYLLNAMAHAAKGTPLGAEITLHQKEFFITNAERYACYLAIAVASELRNLWYGSDSVNRVPGLVNDLREKFSIYEHSDDRGGDKILTVLRGKTQDEQIEFFKIGSAIFRQGKWGSAYGGEYWAKIADAAVRFLSGEINHAIFIDHLYDLRHNGGPIFDKNPMVHQVSGRMGEEFLNQLLECKKHAADASKLRQQLTRIFFEYHITPNGVATFSEEVNSFWAKGLKAGFWKEAKEERHGSAVLSSW